MADEPAGSPGRPVEGEAESPDRRPYSPPVLKRHGTVAELTGKGTVGTDSGRSLSDVAEKQHVTAIDPHEVLDRVTKLAVTQWTYKADPTGARHVGPMAQDFAAAFGLGDDERVIRHVDADGVALSSIQALAELVDALRGRIEALEGRLESLEERRPGDPGLQ